MDWLGKMENIRDGENGNFSSCCFALGELGGMIEVYVIKSLYYLLLLFYNKFSKGHLFHLIAHVFSFPSNFGDPFWWAWGRPPLPPLFPLAKQRKWGSPSIPLSSSTNPAAKHNVRYAYLMELKNKVHHYWF